MILKQLLLKVFHINCYFSKYLQLSTKFEHNNLVGNNMHFCVPIPNFEFNKINPKVKVTWENRKMQYLVKCY